MREGRSLAEACRVAEIKPSSFKREARSALYRSGKNKQWKATKSDRLDAVMNVLTEDGPQPTLVKRFRERARLGRYDNAVRRFRGGERGALADLLSFKGQQVGGRELITDPTILMTLEEAGLLDFDALYTSPRRRR
jgi:hypothetical protein